MERITSSSEFKLWLTSRSRPVAVAMAARAAARVLPLIVTDLDGPKKIGAQRLANYALATFRAAFVASTVALYPSRIVDFRVAAERANKDAYSDARGAKAASAFAVFAAYSETDFNGSPGYIEATVRAASYAAEATFNPNHVWDQLTYDAAHIDDGIIELINRPLWRDILPFFVREPWKKLRNTLIPQDRWTFWIEWYEAMLAGRPIWPELDEAGREALKVQICQIDDDLWASGAAAANAEIQRLIAEAMPKAEKGLEPLSGLPSAFTYGWTAAGRIGVVAGPPSVPWFQHATSEADHLSFLNASRTLAQRLIDDLLARKFDNVRPDYRDALEHYLADLPPAPGQGNLVLADNEMRNLRTLFEAEAAVLPLAFASRLRALLEQHMALRPFYPEIERLYQAVSRGKIASPLPIDNVEKIDRVVAAHTPHILEPNVSNGMRELERAPPPVEWTPEEKRSVEGVILPPPDPLGSPSPLRTREFERASAINQLASVIKSGADLGKGIAGWEVFFHEFSQYAPSIIDWLRQFL